VGADEGEICRLPAPALRRHKPRNVVENALPLFRNPIDTRQRTVEIPFELGVHPLLPCPHTGFDATLLWHSLEKRLTSMFDQSVLP
jgi:hypothetical protein